MPATVVVIGGGYGGVAAAQALDDSARVVLIDPKDAFVHNVASLRSVADPTWADKMFYPYDRVLKRGEVLRDWVSTVEPWGVRLSSGQRVDADYIVVATGTTYPFPAKVDDLEMASGKRRYREVGHALAASLNVLILGAGPVGLELAGEINTRYPKKSITIVEPAADILSRSFVVGFNQDTAARMRGQIHRQLESRGIRLLLGTSLAAHPSIPSGVASPFMTKTVTGRVLDVDIWFNCFGRRPASGLIPPNLVQARRPDEYINVNDYLQLPYHSNIFAIGDVAATKGIDSAVVAMEQGALVAENIITMMNGGKELKKYEPNQPLLLIPIGPDGGVSYSPDGGILDAKTTAMYKGQDLFVEKYREIFGMS